TGSASARTRAISSKESRWTSAGSAGSPKPTTPGPRALPSPWKRRGRSGAFERSHGMDGLTGAIQSISELALWVTDLDRSVAFYRDQLGFTVDEIDPGRNAFLRSGDFLLVLFVPEDPGTPLAEQYLARTGGPPGHVYHVAFP